MIGALDSFEFGLDARREQAIDNPDRLLVGHVTVLGALNGERWSGIGGDPVERAGLNMGGAGVIQIAAEEQRKNLGRIHAPTIRLGEIRRSVVIDYAGYAARLAAVGSIALEPRHAPGQPQKQRQMAAGRASCY